MVANAIVVICTVLMVGAVIWVLMGEHNAPDYDEYKSIADKRLYVEALKDIEDDENSLPVFHNRYERYDYLKKKDNLTPDEQQWIANYEKSDEYKLIYGMEEEV